MRSIVVIRPFFHAHVIPRRACELYRILVALKIPPINQLRLSVPTPSSIN